MLSEEILYSGRINHLGSLVLTKWDGHKLPAERYIVTAQGRGVCDCMGWSRTSDGRCKHVRIAEEVANTGLSWVGAFYDFDRKLLYTPEDGEGIPLRGAFNIPQPY